MQKMLIKFFCKVNANTKLFLFSYFCEMVNLHIVSCANKMAASTALEAKSESLEANLGSKGFKVRDG